MRITKQELQSENKRLSVDHTASMLALNALCNGRVSWFRWQTIRGAQYKVGYFKTPNFEEVYCLITFRVKETGQSDTTSVHRYEDLEYWITTHPYASELQEVYRLATGFVRESEYRAKQPETITA